LSFLAFHFNAPGDFDVVEPEEAHIRTEEYALFRTPQIAKWLEQYGLGAIGFRKMRDDLRSHWAE
jgi:chitin disaccharide deacetylase